MILHFKKDKFRKKKGGQARIYDIHCGKCQEFLFVYQKDGKGNLHRCYLNRILAPAQWAKIEEDHSIRKANDIPNLACPSCDEIVGVPIKRQDGRFCFRLKHGYFHKKYTKFKVE